MSGLLGFCLLLPIGFWQVDVGQVRSGQVGSGQGASSAGLGMRCLALNSTEGRKRFSVMPSLAREVVLVPGAMDEGDAKALGIALRAEVTRLGGQWRVTRSDAEVRAEVRGDAEWVVSEARSAGRRARAAARPYDSFPSMGVPEVLRKARARNGLLRPGGSDFTSGLEAMEMTPAGRLLAEILDSTPAEVLARSAPGEVTVFSDRPVGGELPLPVRGTAMSGYLEAERRFADWAQRPALTGIDDGSRWLLPKEPFQPGGRTLLLTVRRTTAVPSFGLAVFDAKGALESNAELTARGFQPIPLAPAPVPALGVAKLSDETVRAMAEAKVGSPAFDPRRLDPDANDPLDLEVREALGLYARKKGFGKAIACVPDALLPIVRDCIRGLQIDLGEMARRLPTAGIEEIPMGQTLVIRPAHAVHEEALRVDRRPLAAAYRRAAAGGFDSEALTTFHAAYADCYEDRPFLQLVTASMGEAFRLGDSPNWSLPHSVLAVLGELSPSERARLASGRRLLLAPAAHARSLLPLARYVSMSFSLARMSAADGYQIFGAVKTREPEGMSMLSGYPTRILADPAGMSLDGLLAVRTLVKKVQRDDGGITINAASGEVRERKAGTIVDRSFVPFDPSSMLGNLPFSPEQALRWLDGMYRFHWARESHLAVTVEFGRGGAVGPVALRERILQTSDAAVPLTDVPGVDYRPAAAPAPAGKP